jgi:hypothetical protein
MCTEVGGPTPAVWVGRVSSHEGNSYMSGPREISWGMKEWGGGHAALDEMKRPFPFTRACFRDLAGSPLMLEWKLVHF